MTADTQPAACTRQQPTSARPTTLCWLLVLFPGRPGMNYENALFTARVHHPSTKTRRGVAIACGHSPPRYSSHFRTVLQSWRVYLNYSVPRLAMPLVVILSRRLQFNYRCASAYAGN